jgi:hypothetical protein
MQPQLTQIAAEQHNADLLRAAERDRVIRAGSPAARRARRAPLRALRLLVRRGAAVEPGAPAAPA